MFLRQTIALVRKDLLREVRTKETTITTVAFCVLLIAIFAFGFYVEEDAARNVFPGILWISIAFAGTLAIGRTFAQERDSGTLRALALIPGTGLSLYTAKLTLNLVLMALFEVVLVPMLVMIFDIPFAEHAAAHLAIIALGTLGFAALGTLVSAMLVNHHLRDAMLPILLYPLAIPLIVAGLVVTRSIVTGELESVWNWIRVVAAMDVVFTISSALLFRWVLSAIE